MIFREEKSMVMKLHGNVRGEVRVNFLALFASKAHIFMCGTLKLSGIVRPNVCLNIAIPVLFLSHASQRAQRSKKFDLDRNFQSRSKFLISLENLNLDVSISPQKNRAAVARSKISFSIEISNFFDL